MANIILYFIYILYIEFYVLYSIYIEFYILYIFYIHRFLYSIYIFYHSKANKKKIKTDSIHLLIFIINGFDRYENAFMDFFFNVDGISLYNGLYDLLKYYNRN